MKKKTLRGMLFGLAATSIVSTTSGCENKKSSIPENAVAAGGISYENGLSNYAKDNYNDEKTSSEKIRIEDIVVIDTEKESGESVFVEGEKRYYILFPHHKESAIIDDENGDFLLYKMCNNNGYGAISFIRKFVILDNSLTTIYTVIKKDGELECVFFLRDVLKELGLEDCLQAEYASMDLQILEDKLNEKQMSLTLK